MPDLGFGEIGEKLRRSTVQVRRGRSGCGSGVIWSADGLVITNAHVTRDGRGLTVELWDGSRRTAQLESVDMRRDLAALRIGATDLSPATIGDSDVLRVGELAIAIGNPFGFAGALSTGVIHAVGPVHGLGSRTWVQADVRLAPGNSGGPLADARGRVIGLNTMVAGGIGLAIPSNAAGRFVRVGPSAYTLGVTVRPVALGRGKESALLVLAVTPGSAAHSASILVGDLLLAANEKRLRDADDLSDALDRASGGIVHLQFSRGDRTLTRRVTVQLHTRSAAA